MPSELTTHAVERSVYGIVVSFVDDTGAATTPSAATWTLTDSAGEVVNSRTAVAISPLATTATIVLSGADLALLTTLQGNARYFLVEYTYSSSLGVGLPAKDQVLFYIDDLAGVTA